MDDTDELSTHLRASLSDIRLNEPIDRIQARGRALRRRRRHSMSALAAVVVATVASLAVALNGPGNNNAEIHVDLAAWSVDTTPDGTVTVTVRELTDPERLRDVLTQAGVPAKVQFLQIPSGTPIGCREPQGRHVIPSNDILSEDDAGVWTIKAAAMPDGSVLNFVVIKTLDGQALTTIMSLHAGEPGTCVPLTEEDVRAELEERARTQANSQK
jgi:hypothetical protein